MLSAERSAIEKNVLLNLVELQEKELDFYISNNESIGTMSVLLIGFAFAPELPMVISGELENYPIIDPFFHLSITLCVGCNILCSVLCVFVNIHGSRLALNGPSGSLRQAVKLMSKWQGRISLSFFCGCLAFVVEFILYSCMQGISLMTGFTTLLTTCFLAFLIASVVRVSSDFSIDESDRVTSELSREVLSRMEKDGNLQADERAMLLARARGGLNSASRGGTNMVSFDTSYGGAGSPGGGGESGQRAVSEDGGRSSRGQRGGGGGAKLGQLFGGPRS